MSKFAKMIDATITGDRKYRPLKYATAKLDTGNANNQFGTCKAVKIGATFSSIIYIDEFDIQRRPDAIETAMKDIKAAMVEEMFGEFRGTIRDAIAGTYDMDMDRVRDALVSLEAAMYRDGI